MTQRHPLSFMRRPPWRYCAQRGLRRSLHLGVAMLVALGLAAGWPPLAAQAPPDATARQALEALHQRWLRAVQTKNLGELANLYLQSDKLRQIPARRALRLEGWEAVRRSFDRLFAGAETLQLDVFHRDVAIFGATGIVSAYIEVTTSTGQQQTRLLVRQTQVYHKFPKAWKLVHEHLSEVAR